MIGYNPLQPTIFHEPWWLNTVAGDRLREVHVCFDNKIVGRLPFILFHRFGGQVACEMPAFTHFLGPAIDSGSGSAVNRALRHASILGKLLDQLPKTDAFYQRMHRGIQDTMVFQEKGYQTPVHFTFEIPPAPPSIIWKNMRDKTRNVIRRAQERQEISEILDPLVFADFYRKNVERQGRRFYYQIDELVRICGEAIVRKRGRVIGAYAAKNLSAAIFYVWDNCTCYYLLSTRENGADNGDISLLIWHAICHATSLGLIFDFDGVSSHGSRIFFTAFGGEIKPRYIASRYSPSYEIAEKIRKAFWRSRIAMILK